MTMQLFDKHFARTLFALAGVLLLAAIAEAMLQLFGVSAIGHSFSPGRIMELAATLLLFAVVQLLRQIRDSLHSR